MTIQVAEKLIKKRTGKIVVHDPSKIVSAIYRAMQSLGRGDEKQAAQIASGIEEKLLNLFFSKNGIPEVEDVQDFVEEALMKWGLFDVAKSFIVYRHERRRIRNQENVILDVKKTIEQYLGLDGETGKDWRVKENANTDFDYPGLNAYISGTHLARYALYSLYPPEVAESHVTGHLHIHDLSNSIVGYCSGWSLQLLLQKGFGGVRGRVSSRPPKHLDSAINQMITFLGTLQNEFAGAQAFSSVDTLLSPFIREKFCQSVKKILRQTFSLKANGHVYSLLDMLYAYKKGEKSADEVRDRLEELYPNVIFSTELMQTFLRSFFEEYEDNVFFIRQNIQNLIYAVNQTSRWGGQPPFINLSFDWTAPDDLADQQSIMSGKTHPQILYRDCQTEIDIFNKVFIEEMLGGDKHNRIFTFPIPTYSITKDFDWDHPNVDLLMKITAKYGIPYFQNYSNSGLEPSSIRAMCCRLNLNILELQNRPGGMWNIGDSTGSIGVVTINLNRLGYLAINKTDFFRLLRKYMDLAQISLEIKRKEVTRNFENGMMAYASEYLPHGFKTYFSTIGLCGMHECSLNFLNKGINTPEGLEFAQEVLQFMRDVCIEYKTETGNLYNLEASPAESTSYRFARLDRKWYPKVILSGSDEAPYLTNSTHLPVDATNDLIEAIEHQNVLQPIYTGGCIEENSRVMTSKGLKPIKTIVEGFSKGTEYHVYSFNETTMKTEIKQVTEAKFVHVEEEDKLVISLERGAGITTSSWHPFYIIDENLEINTKRADELKEGDYVISSSLPIERSKDFGDENAWLYGLFLTDGYYGKYLSFNSQNEKTLDKVFAILTKIVDESTIHYYKHRKEVRINHKTSKLKVAKYMFNVEPGAKSKSVYIKPKFLTWNISNRINLLAGIIDGDGNVPESGKYIRICTGSHKFSLNILELLASLGLYGTVQEKESFFYVFINRRQYVKIIDGLKESLSYESKVNRLKDIESEGRQGLFCTEEIKNKANYSHNTGKYKTKGRISIKLAEEISPILKNISGAFVKKIEKSEHPTKFCDLTVEGNNNYLAGNNSLIFIHNTIFHTFIGEEIEPEVCKSMVRLLAEQTRLPYFSITPTFSICTEHKYIKGKHFECPHCGKPTEVYSRIVGYFRPISKWNNGKTQEFKDRTTFEVNQSSFSNIRDIIQEDLQNEKSSSDSFSEMIVEEPLSKPVSSNHTNGKYISLFISPSCPKCSPFKEQISSTIDSIKIKTINTATEEGYRLAEVYNIQELPTAVIINDEQEIGRFTTMKGMNNLLPDLKRLFGNNESN